MSELEPLLAGCRGQTSERADDALAGPLGGVQGFDQQVVGVAFALPSFGRLADVHRTLHITRDYLQSSRILTSFVTIYAIQQPSVEKKNLTGQTGGNFASYRGSWARSLVWFALGCGSFVTPPACRFMSRDP